MARLFTDHCITLTGVIPHTQFAKLHTYVYDAIRLFPPPNDLYCVGWGVKLYSLTHSATQ